MTESEAFVAALKAKIEERAFAILASNPKIHYDRDGLRGALGPGAELVVDEVHEDGSLTCSVVFVAPIEAVVISSAVDPRCHPMAPCGRHGCGICNGAQAPLYGYGATTPALGVPAMASCGNCGSATCNQCRAARGMGPAGVTPRAGSAKPNGGGSKATKAANAERGYRVCSYATWLNTPSSERPGECFATPDMATQRARKGAKEGKETFLVLRDGARWKLLKADGDEVVIG